MDKIREYILSSIQPLEEKERIKNIYLTGNTRRERLLKARLYKRNFKLKRKKHLQYLKAKNKSKYKTRIKKYKKYTQSGRRKIKHRIF